MNWSRRYLALALLVGACGDASTGLPAPTTFTIVPRIDATTIPPPTFASRATTLPGEVLPERPTTFGFSESSAIFRKSESELARDFDGMSGLGVRWVRLDLQWAYVQEHGPDEWRWDKLDLAVRLARERELDVLALLAYTPAWARPEGTSDKHPPSNPDDFARYAREVSRRYAPLGVSAFEIWNEPNVSSFWQPRPDPEGYTTLLQRASAAIRAEDPGATIVTGGLAPASDRSDGREIRDRTFLGRVYAAGGREAFDAVGLHPYTWPELPGHAADWNTFLGIADLRRVMVDQGDEAKRVWGTEFGAPTIDRGRGVSEARQRDTVIDGYSRWSAYDFTGPLLWFTYRDDGTTDAYDDHYGLLAVDGRRKPGYDAFRALLDAEYARLTAAQQ
jgi:polysaccharide biosynthesis protein PslG